MLIRTEKEADQVSVRVINSSAFDTSSEADLVDTLRLQAKPSVSLVAEENGAVIGHIMFSPVSLLNHPELKVMGLGPIAVAPSHQGKGTGSALVRKGLEKCRQLDFAAVVVLGHPEYYPRFGFMASSHFGIHSEYDVPEEAFMAIELQPEALNQKTGEVRYHRAFSNV